MSQHPLGEYASDEDVSSIGSDDLDQAAREDFKEEEEENEVDGARPPSQNIVQDEVKPAPKRSAPPPLRGAEAVAAAESPRIRHTRSQSAYGHSSGGRFSTKKKVNKLLGCSAFILGRRASLVGYY